MSQIININISESTGSGGEAMDQYSSGHTNDFSAPAPDTADVFSAAGSHDDMPHPEAGGHESSGHEDMHADTGIPSPMADADNAMAESDSGTPSPHSGSFEAARGFEEEPSPSASDEEESASTSSDDGEPEPEELEEKKPAAKKASTSKAKKAT
ncbi:hypothetical protein [Flocculibacter collagenilyticus]|uniref:hypothetical protein n=1 Tax=Flocculibacter collagenilyticus TaxID=2744479 RepID=UPI0018F77141|nr:hypothetical protein [Flocculibacter collagenilyticus]